jgi:hypothetical protein
MPTGDARDLATLARQADIAANGFTAPDGTLTACPRTIPYQAIFRCVDEDGTVDEAALALVLNRYRNRPKHRVVRVEEL